MDSNILFERNADLIVADMDGELVMMDAEQGNYFAINQVGAHIWNSLETPQSFAVLSEGVSKAFKDADQAQIQSDVRAFLTDLKDQKMVREIAA